jgi:CheY-like chemotaxis protein
LGLGLTIARTLVAMHGGTVTAHSEGRARGSEFVVEIPAVGVGEGPAAQRPHAVAGGHACKILVVDDNRDLVQAIALVLGKLGHEVRVAFDGPSALAIAQEFAPDVALLDIGLPGLDGYEVASRLRASSAHDVRLIAVSGYGQATDRQRSHDAGFDSHLVKPVDVAMLQHTIEESRARLR